MQNKEILALARSGILPLALLKLWEARTGTNPITLAESLETHVSSEERRITIMALLGALVVIVAPGVALWCESVDMPVREYNGFIMFVFMVVGWFWFAFWVSRFRDVPSTTGQISNDAGGFENAFGELVELVDRSPENLATLSETDFRELATDLMQSVAGEVLALEAKNDGVPYYIWADESAALSEKLKRRYNVLKAFGLVQGGYDPYFKLARTKAA